jgi:transcriptional regulator with PAS, ATPase and Fis domain
MMPPWADALGVAVTVCDREGRIVYMNAASQRVFASQGGAALIGRSLLDCHPDPARSKVATLLAEGGTNAYTIEKNGQRKLIWQGPWHADGEVAGLVEISIPLPADLPHFVRG